MRRLVVTVILCKSVFRAAIYWRFRRKGEIVPVHVIRFLIQRFSPYAIESDK